MIVNNTYTIVNQRWHTYILFLTQEGGFVL
jgi:hypothetical protein